MKKAAVKYHAFSTLFAMSTLFCFATLFGWVFELFVRRFGADGWSNPGMLRGPYLPVYGFGGLTLYLLSSLRIPIKNKGLRILLHTLVMGVALTLVEYVAGLLFVRGLGLPLWDYSGFRGNVQGLICPLCSLFWTVLAGVYLLWLHPLVLRLKDVAVRMPLITFLPMLWIGAMLFDFITTLCFL